MSRGAPFDADSEPASAEPPLQRLIYVHPVRLNPTQADIIQVMETCHAIARRGVDCHLVSRGLLEGTEQDLYRALDLEAHPSLTLHFLEKLGKDSSLANRFRQRRALKKKITLLGRDARSAFYVRSLRSPLMLETLDHLGETLGIPRIQEVHAIVHRDPQAEGVAPNQIESTRALECRFLSSADGVVANSPGTGSEIQDLVSPSLLAVIPNGVRFRAWEEADPRWDVVYVGSLHRWKGVDTVLEAVALRPELSVAIVGSGDPETVRELKNRCDRDDLRGRVTWTGPLSRRDALSHLGQGRLAMVPLAEGSPSAERFTCPLKLREAMMQGIPAVVADRPAIRALIEDKSLVYWDRFSDPAELAATLGRALESEDSRRRMARRAWEFATQWTWETRAARVIEFVQRVVDARVGLRR